MVRTEAGVKKWSLAGVIVLIVLGSILHYVFSWTGEATMAGLLLPVNESVWEHLKMGYWALVLFSVFEYPQLKDKVNNYFLAKLAGIIALELTILIIFYTYSSLTEKNIVWIDISSYVFGAIMCQ